MGHSRHAQANVRRLLTDLCMSTGQLEFTRRYPPTPDEQGSIRARSNLLRILTIPNHCLVEKFLHECNTNSVAINAPLSKGAPTYYEKPLVTPGSFGGRVRALLRHFLVIGEPSNERRFRGPTNPDRQIPKSEVKFENTSFGLSPVLLQSSYGVGATCKIIWMARVSLFGYGATHVGKLSATAQSHTE